jgi:maltooligosyltrehalose trehalohydrolase
LSQPKGVHGPSEAIALSEFAWHDQKWVNPLLKNYILYELHTGTFSPSGNFNGIIERIPHLKNLGITAVELMPIAQFPGQRNWGYDGVFPFAVQSSYGGAKDFQKLVDIFHQHGIAVVVDVVYNHFGPEGNYLPEFGPYFTDKYKTPWGKALNFDDAGCDAVRDYFIENALMWFRDFHVDALRLDAVHAIKDFSATHILQEIKEATDKLSSITGKEYYLITELDLNDPRFIDPIEKGGYGMNAQWVDEFHHALRVTSGQEKTGYYQDFDGIHHLAKSLTDAYVYDGQYSPHRDKHFGRKVSHHDGDKFIVFSQNHDQVGNRMLGERTSQLVSFDMLKVLAGITILSPFIPMLFMGEEYGETNPFLYFVDHGDAKLIEAIRKGRKEEFNAFHAQGDPPDAALESTFTQSKLQWNLNAGKQKELLEYYKNLIELRKNNEALHNPDRKNSEVVLPNNQVLVLHRWKDENHFWIILNFSTNEQRDFLSVKNVERILCSVSNDITSVDAITVPPASITIYKKVK